MTSTTFVDLVGPPVNAAWLNDVNAATYAGEAVYTPAGTGAVATTVQTKLRESVSVKDFGAKGDGVANDTTAFALALVSNSTHQTIYFPPGTYVLNPEINMGIYKRIVGAGRDQTILNFACNTATAALLVDQYCSIEGVTIQNTGSNTTTSTGVCSYTPTTGNGFANGSLKDCKVIGFGYGVAATTSTVSPFGQSLTRSQMFNSKIWNVIFSGCGVPIQLGTGANAISVKGCWFTGTTGANNIVLNQVLLPVIDSDNTFQGTASGVDISLTACMSPKVSGYFEPAKGILLDSCPEAEVSNCILNGQSFAFANSFVTTALTSNTWGFPIPLRNTVKNITLYGSGSGKFCSSSSSTPANIYTLTDAITNSANDWTANGTASYPMFPSAIPTGTTGNGSASVANAATQTIVALASAPSGRYEVFAYIRASGNTALYASVATVLWDTSTSRLIANNGTNTPISISGTNVIVTNSTGSTFTFDYGYLRIGA